MFGKIVEINDQKTLYQLAWLAYVHIARLGCMQHGQRHMCGSHI